MRGLLGSTVGMVLLAVACGGPATPGPSGGGELAASGPGDRTADERPGFSTVGWRTDFTRHSVSLGEITSGGPAKDGIPPVDHPKFLPASGDVDWLRENEPVIALVIQGNARAYPLQIIIWHEIVNDTVGGVPVTVTFCPLCNTAIVFDRRLRGTVYDFGTSGNLRYSDLVMYDRQTESFWQQVTGEAIVGELTGAQLKMLPASIMSYRDFRTAYPTGRVLSRETGFSRSYGSNPYTGYDDIRSSPFLFRGPSDNRLPPMERVVAVSADGRDVAYPFSLLRERGVINDPSVGEGAAVFWASGTASALDRDRIAESRDVGAAAVYRAVVDGRRLTFAAGDSGSFVDAETGSTWNLAGHAVAGPLTGRTLEPLLHGNHFWFAWAVFKPQTEVYGG